MGVESTLRAQAGTSPDTTSAKQKFMTQCSRAVEKILMEENFVWLIVDGYNVLKSNSRTAPLRGDNLRAERERFIKSLHRYHGQREDKVTVVFDGYRGNNDFPDRSRVGDVEVIYSHRGQTADEVIKQMVEESLHPSEIMVVSSDREISTFVKSLGATVTGARHLANRLELFDENNVQHLEEMDKAAYYERHVKGYLGEEKTSPKRRKGKSRRPKRARSSLKLWSSI